MAHALSLSESVDTSRRGAEVASVTTHWGRPTWSATTGRPAG